MFGVQPHHYQQLHQQADEWKEYLWLIDPSSPEESSHPRLPNFPILELIKAAKRVKKANQKIVAFERGFISESGIKDREWYRHLGVAPGKWLGNAFHYKSFYTYSQRMFRRLWGNYFPCSNRGSDHR